MYKQRTRSAILHMRWMSQGKAEERAQSRASEIQKLFDLEMFGM